MIPESKSPVTLFSLYFAVGTANNPLSVEKEGLGASGEPSVHPTQSLDQSKSHRGQDRDSTGTGERLASLGSRSLKLSTVEKAMSLSFELQDNPTGQ